MHFKKSRQLFISLLICKKKNRKKKEVTLVSEQMVARALIQNSRRNLVRSAEDVGIVLLKPADAGQAAQRSRQLVSMKNAKVGETDRQLSPRPDAMVKHQAIRVQNSPFHTRDKNQTKTAESHSDYGHEGGRLYRQILGVYETVFLLG